MMLVCHLVCTSNYPACLFIHKNAFHIFFIYSDSLHDGVSFVNINIHDHCCDGQKCVESKEKHESALGQ